MSERTIILSILVIPLLITSAMLQPCKGTDNNITQAPVCADAAKFISVSYIDLSKIARISRFRSGEGHDYSDDSENCRSMKHYFEPNDTVDWSAVDIFSPIDATVTTIRDESPRGLQVELLSTSHPNIVVTIFHVKLDVAPATGMHYTAGQHIGKHVGSITMSDIAVRTNSPYRLHSLFEFLSDTLFAQFIARGVPTRDTMIIPEAARDADPLNCLGDSFGTAGTLENWVVLQ